MREPYIKVGEGFLLVYSAVDNASFKNLAEIWTHIRSVKDTEEHIPTLLIGNKVIIDNYYSPLLGYCYDCDNTINLL